MPDTECVLTDLARLAAFPTLTLDDAFLDDTLRQFSNEAVLHYVQTMKRGGALEAATEELLVAVVRDCVGIALTTKLIIGIPGDPNKKNIDYALCEGEDTLAIELKPLFKRMGKTRQTLVPNDLKNADGNLADYREQVTNYLQYVEFVVLSNAREAYFFSRTSAQLQFQPFATRSFADFVRFLSANKANVFDALRRLEAESATINSNLDTLFFGSLKQWVREFRERVKFSAKEDDPTKKFTRDEAIVLLINKIVFIKTAEDYGLIQFRYLVSAYKQQRGFWLGKRNAKIFEDFFRQVEDYFEIYYNTDLFAEHFWHYVEQSPANIESFRRVFEQVLGVDKWDASFGNGLLHYNYRQIDEDIFGKAYETFIAEERKDSGIFYTPVPLAKYMTRQTVGELMRPLVNEIIAALDKNNPDVTRAEALLAELQQIRLIDTTSGSGSFLIKILRDVFAEYDRIEETLAWTRDLAPNVLFSMPDDVRRVSEFRTATFDNRYAFVSRTVLYHVCAADMDERALETAKTNLWKELLKLPTPNAPQSYHIGTLQKAGRDHILPNLELNFICGDMLIDLPIQTQVDVLRRDHTAEIVRLHELRSTYLDNLFDLAPVEEVKHIRQTLHEHLLGELPEEMRGILSELGRKPVFVCAEFFYAWFGADGEPLPVEKQGFHAVISNPPWEVLKPVAKEFAGVGKYEMSKQQFDKHFAEMCKEKPDFAAAWELYRRKYDVYRNFLREKYSFQGEGDLNLFKLFIERDTAILRPDAPMTLLVPSGIQTDKECADLRRMLFNDLSLRFLLSFENRGYEEFDEKKQKMKRIKFFPAIHPQYKFTIFKAYKRVNADPDSAFDTKFFITKPKEVEEKPALRYTSALVRRFSPENLSVMEFDNERDFEICAHLRGQHSLLGDAGYSFRREFHMTDDAGLFLPLKGLPAKETTAIAKTHLPLYEGKMMHQFNANFSSANYAVSEEAGRKQLALVEAARIKRQFELKDKPAVIAEKYFASGLFLLDYEAYRLVYRAVASSTNERTLIAAIAPKRVFAGNSLNYCINYFYEQDGDTIRQQRRSAADMLWLVSLVNSLALNYYIRNKVSANLNMFFLYELPVPAVQDKVKRSIAEQGFVLLAANAQGKEFDELGAELGVSGSFAMRGGEEAIMRRAGLEVQIARDVYGLRAEEWQHIVSTFSYGGDSDTKQELDAVIAASLALFAE